jgi:hypothetical protein
VQCGGGATEREGRREQPRLSIAMRDEAAGGHWRDGLSPLREERAWQPMQPEGDGAQPDGEEPWPVSYESEAYVRNAQLP